MARPPRAAGTLSLLALLLAASGAPAGQPAEEPAASCEASGGAAGAAGAGLCPEDGPAAELVPPLRLRVRKYEGSKGSGNTYGGELALASFRARGFRLVEDDSWDVLWTHFSMHKVLDGMALPPRTGGRDRLASQCGYFMAAGQKCRLARHVAAVRAALGGSVEGRHPPTYELKNQTQFNAWRAAAQSDLGLHWIVKPCAAGRSAGIRLLSGSEVAGIAEPAWDSWDVAQAYLDPYMGFGGRKFHLRLYLLVTRWSPAGALLYDSGLVLRSRRAYTEGRRSDEDIFSAISDDVEPLALAALWGQIGGEAAGRVWSEIGALFAELLGHRLAESFGDPRRLLERPYGCFDLFGADVLLDAGLRPFLLEVNMGPNLYVEGRGAYREVLRQVKAPLVEQVVDWLALRARRAPQGREAAEALEASTLLNFTRVL